MTESEKRTRGIGWQLPRRRRKGIMKRLSKEENQRMTRRTEERLEIAKAKENLWRKFRERKETEEMMEEEEEEAWKSLRKGIMELEEEGGSWRESAKDPRMIMITSNRILENTRGNQTVKVMESVGNGVKDK